MKNKVESIKIKKSKASRIVFCIVFIIFLLYAIGILYPFFYGFTISLKKNGREFMANTTKITFPFYFSNYLKAFKSLTLDKTTFPMMIFNSIWYSVGSTLMTMIASTCVAYIVAKYPFKGSTLIYDGAIIVMMIPIYGSLPAQYKLFSRLGMINSPLILMASFGGFGMYFIYIHAFFKSLSWSYAEAAFIDGASNLTVFLKIMVPMLLPSLSALSIMNFVGVWNDYAGPYLWLNEMPTLASGLYVYEFNMRYTANQPVYFAGVILSIIPALIIFIVFQNTIMSNVYSGGLKG